MRDWWQVDWMWSALHLQDGTRLHAVGVPALPAHGVGYVQAAGVITELDRVQATHAVRPDGLIGDASIELSPGDVGLELEPLAWGPLRLEGSGGRLAYFVRAMCRTRTSDGRSGIGWVEWNCVQPPTVSAGDVSSAHRSSS